MDTEHLHGYSGLWQLWLGPWVLSIFLNIFKTGGSSWCEGPSHADFLDKTSGVCLEANGGCMQGLCEAHMFGGCLSESYVRWGLREACFGTGALR